MRDKYEINLKSKVERFVMLSEDVDIVKVENLAKKKACTKSWIYRALLFALVKKFPNELPRKFKVKRPQKFKEPFRQTTICFYGDRSKWFSLCRIWKVELGPLIRFAQDLFEQGELELDLEDEQTVKEVKHFTRGKKSRKRIQRRSYRYMYQNNNICYGFEEYWLKNPIRNLIIMKRGLNNRIHPLILPKNFKIPKSFNP